MLNKNSDNLEMLIAASKTLQPIIRDLVFIGGCVTDLYITDKLGVLSSNTKDVDVLIEVIGQSNYYKLEKKLRKLGLKNKADNEVICSWLLETDGTELTLDIIPTDENILGFSNIWHSEAIKNYKIEKIDDEIEIKITTAPIFIAIKIAAFLSRGNQDYFLSKDIEDIVVLLNGRKEIADEVQHASNEIKSYLAEQFNIMIKSEDFLDALNGHMCEYNDNNIIQYRTNNVKSRIKLIIDAMKTNRDN